MINFHMTQFFLNASRVVVPHPFCIRFPELSVHFLLVHNSGSCRWDSLDINEAGKSIQAGKMRQGKTFFIHCSDAFLGEINSANKRLDLWCNYCCDNKCRLALKLPNFQKSNGSNLIAIQEKINQTFPFRKIKNSTWNFHRMFAKRLGKHREIWSRKEWKAKSET